MNYIKSLISGGVVLAMLCLALPVSAATITVTTEADELDSVTDCTDNPSDCSLREAISQANADEEADTIVLSDGTYTLSIAGDSENENATGDLDLTLGDITINGESEAGTILDGGAIDRVFHILSTSGEVALSNLTIRNGHTDADGAGIYVSNNSAAQTFTNVTVDSNISLRSGGGMYLNYSDITADNLTISNNDTDRFGGGISTATRSGISLTCTDCVISNNSSDSNGGGMHLARGTYLFSNSSITDNETEADGGGFSTYGGDITVDETVISGNTADQEGGAVYIYRIDDLVISNSVISNNTALSKGGAFSLTSSSTTNTSTMNVLNTTIEGNSTNGRGGAIYGEKNLLYLDFVTLTDNTADADGSGTTGYGGGMYFDENQNTVEISNSIINNNVVGSSEFAENCYSQTADFITSGGYNVESGDTCNFGENDLTDTDPLLDTEGLEDNGGDVETIALQSSSPAIDLVPAASCLDHEDAALTRDAREMTRPDNTNCDAGAFEVDQTAPTVSFSETTLECAADTWSNSSVTASDNYDSSVSVNLTGTVSDDAVGAYTLSYSSTDASGNEASGDQDITVEDTADPTLSVTGESSVTISEGDSYTDQGATATDACDSSVTVTSSGSVDSDTPGTYTITYTATDDSDNTDTATRTVTVEEVPDGTVINDPETGEGDGSDDTEESLGAVVDLTRSTDSTVTVEYENGDTKTFQLFNASAKAKVQLHTNGEILIAINKRYMRTFNAFTGEQIDQVKLFKSAQYKTKFKRFNIYKKVPGKNNVMVLAQTKKKHKKQFKLRSFVVKNGGAITKRPYRTIRLNKNAKFSKLSIAKNKKNGKNARILIKKKGKTLKNWKYRVTAKKGILKKAI